ncbi:respiratory nitrate reductase subunit gamma [Pseudodesulfovibrio sp.]|nr:respiratory nitrate reductase subunit gamma [Pseudodesulfovibrio sp.]
MYELLTGPILWLAFAIAIVGLITRTIFYIKGLNWKLDRVAYTAHPGAGAKGAIRSILAFLIPFANHSWRAKPGFTIMFFVFHIGLLGVPLLLEGHAVILMERFGISWPTISMASANFWTIAMLVAAMCIAIRRLILPEVRIITDAKDWFILIVSIAPFITGYMVVNELGDYNFWLLTHIVSGLAWIALLPFTKLFHAVGFFWTRAQLGMDFGIKRGGMKYKSFDW